MDKQIDPANIDIGAINSKFFDTFQLDDKSDSLSGYLYLKYILATARALYVKVGNPVGEPIQQVNKGVSEMIDMFADQVIARGLSKDTSIMHGKIVTLESAKKLVSQTQNMHLVPSEKVIPFKVTREFILENPDHIALGRCMCRAAAPKSCIPPSEQNLCVWIGEPNVSFMISQNPYFKKVSPKEAIQVLEDAHKAGFYQCAYFEKPASDRFNCICNCCNCCCFGLKSWPLFGSNDNPFLAPSGYAPKVSNTCNGCGDCEKRCRFEAIKVDKKTQIAIVNMDRCMGCAFCEEACNVGAIKMQREPKLGEPLDIDTLKAEAGIKD